MKAADVTRVEYSAEARNDIEGIVATIESQNPTAAWRFLDSVEGTVEVLRTHPRAGGAYAHPRHPNLRAITIAGFRRYVLFYDEIPERVLLVRLLHGARDMNVAL